MQSSTSLSSLSSNNSSIYGSQTILNLEDLPRVSARCRSSIISLNDSKQIQYSSTNRRSTGKCRHLFRTCLTSTSSSLTSLIQKKLSDPIFRKQYFSKLCLTHRVLFVLNDYQCKCGCHFSIKQGTFVVLYESNSQLSSYLQMGIITVISNELICSKVPCEYLCDIDVLRERVRSRRFCSNEQSFDL